MLDSTTERQCRVDARRHLNDRRQHPLRIVRSQGAVYFWQFCWHRTRQDTQPDVHLHNRADLGFLV